MDTESVKRQRINVLLWAYAYEFENVSIVEDSVFDLVCSNVYDNVFEPTDRSDLDDWFIENFEPDTGMWIQKFPEKDKIQQLYNRLVRTGVINDF